MSLDLDVDCGEVLTGHSLRVTGLRPDGRSDDSMLADYSGHHDAKPVHDMVSLTYVLTPGLPAGALPHGRDVNAEIVLDPPADPAYWEPVLAVGGERDLETRPNFGPDQTCGAFGPFVLPEDTVTVTVRFTNDGITQDGRPPVDDSPSRVIGHLHIDLTTRTARWRPAA